MKNHDGKKGAEKLSKRAGGRCEPVQLSVRITLPRVACPNFWSKARRRAALPEPWPFLRPLRAAVLRPNMGGTAWMRPRPFIGAGPFIYAKNEDLSCKKESQA